MSTKMSNLTNRRSYDTEKSEADYRKFGQTQKPFVALHTRQRIRQTEEGAVARESVIPFFLLAFLFSWIVTVPLALKAQGIVQLPLPSALHYLSGYGPLAAAFLLTGRNGGWRALRPLLNRMFRWRVPIRWWLVALTPLLFYALLEGILWLLRGRPPTFGALGQLNFLPDLGLAALPFWIFTFGLGEETGWRGYALPRLQRRRSALSATIILWFFWTLWHLPLFFYAYDSAVLPGFLPGLFAAAIVFTWLYNSTGSILIAAVWHGLFNYTTACTVCGAGIEAAAISTLVMIGAVILIVVSKALTLAPDPRL